MIINHAFNITNGLYVFLGGNMEIQDTRSPVTSSKDAVSIPVGTVFSGTVGSAESIFLRAFDKIVDLRWPEFTWDLINYDPVVTDYKKLNAKLVILPDSEQ